jgi:hypothetical protein
MDYLLDLLQGAGLAAAIGIRPFLPVLLAGALAVADVGLDFEGTDFSFLETWPFLLGVLVLVVVFDFAGRRAGRERAEAGTLGWILLGLAVLLGALEAAGSIADHSEDWWPGIPIGVACAVLGYAAARSLFTRVRRRLDAEAAGALPVYAEGAAVVAAGLSILFPPLAVLVLAGLAWLLLGSRRRTGEKYAGLRILR